MALKFEAAARKFAAGRVSKNRELNHSSISGERENPQSYRNQGIKSRFLPVPATSC